MIAKCESPVTDNKEQATSLKVASLNIEALLAVLDVVRAKAFEKYPNNGTWAVNYNYRYAYVYEMLHPNEFCRETMLSGYSVGVDILAEAVADNTYTNKDIVRAYLHAHNCGVKAARKAFPFRTQWSVEFTAGVQDEFEDYLQAIDLIGEEEK